MIIPKIRRTLNDSYIGRKINSSKAGLVVEAIFRQISDDINDEKYRSAPDSSFEDFMFNGYCPVLESIGRDMEREADPQRAYSWTTPFYKKIRTEDGREKMKRVRLEDIFLNL